MNKQMTPAEIDFAPAKLREIYSNLGQGRFGWGRRSPLPPPNIPAAIALASVTMK